MADKTVKNEMEKTQTNEVSDQPSNRKKGNKTIVMIGGVVFISVGCAFLFVSKVYPSLTGDAQLNTVGHEKEVAEDVSEVQTVSHAEAEKLPLSTSKKKNENGKEDKNNIIEESLIISVDPVIVNLSGSGGRRYLKATINLEAKDGDIKKKMEAKTVQIKDRLIFVLSSKTLEDIEGPEGQEILRREIQDAVDVVIKKEDGVLQVYFTEFVVQ
ncbi:MAG: flagellar basal body-associated FliL family protein [Planctomycetia bacterium]|nr:flagellar basal body-associated FliL family protein [Planctomycetia bacterium]